MENNNNKITIPSNWKYSIKIKHLLTKKTTPEIIITLCNSLIFQLNIIKEKVDKSNLLEDDIYYLISNLEEVIDNFAYLNQLADQTILESEWENYGFASDFQSEFNRVLNSLYNLADLRVLNKNNVQEKFLWIY